MGFVYFQGYFFCRPEVVIGREVPASRLHYLRARNGLPLGNRYA